MRGSRSNWCLKALSPHLSFCAPSQSGGGEGSFQNTNEGAVSRRGQECSVVSGAAHVLVGRTRALADVAMPRRRREWLDAEHGTQAAAAMLAEAAAEEAAAAAALGVRRVGTMDDLRCLDEDLEDRCVCIRMESVAQHWQGIGLECALHFMVV